MAPPYGDSEPSAFKFTQAEMTPRNSGKSNITRSKASSGCTRATAPTRHGATIDSYLARRGVLAAKIGRSQTPDSEQN